MKIGVHAEVRPVSGQGRSDDDAFIFRQTEEMQRLRSSILQADALKLDNRGCSTAFQIFFHTGIKAYDILHCVADVYFVIFTKVELQHKNPSKLLLTSQIMLVARPPEIRFSIITFCRRRRQTLHTQLKRSTGGRNAEFGPEVD